MSNFSLSLLFFLQLVIILAVCRATGIVARRVGQPQVVAEMIAGVLLGPSLFGLLLPNLHARLFPPMSMSVIYVISQVGLVLYMFLVGLEYDVELIRKRIRSAIAVSAAGILLPFALGCVLASLLIRDNRFFTPELSLPQAMLFLGAAMSITAFPMLARIIFERGLTGTSLGALALAAGSLDDAAAWCILAVVLASFSGDSRIALVAIGGGISYAVFVLVIGRRLLRHIGKMADREKRVTPPVFSFVIMLVMLGAWFTDLIQIYAVFGAFILGLAMPRGIFARDIQRKLEPLTTNILLPLFFVYSGLNTRLGLVNTVFLWSVTLLVLMTACLGKGVGCWLAARINGESQREAVSIGTLMNARGLMELIILNIGLERGIITPTLFTIMVLMAALTTLAASPVFEFVNGDRTSRILRLRAQSEV
jgi:Kef-type K+ transport system membrane component KefB